MDDDAPPEDMSHDDIKTYGGGHRTGRQYQKWERADQIRQRNRQQVPRWISTRTAGWKLIYALFEVA